MQRGKGNIRAQKRRWKFRRKFHSNLHNQYVKNSSGGSKMGYKHINHEARTVTHNPTIVGA